MPALKDPDWETSEKLEKGSFGKARGRPALYDDMVRHNNPHSSRLYERTNT